MTWSARLGRRVGAVALLVALAVVVTGADSAAVVAPDWTSGASAPPLAPTATTTDGSGVAAGDPSTIDREVVHRVGASLERRLGGRHASSLAVWLTPLADALAGADALASTAELVARGVVEGSFDPKALYRDDAENLPPALDELVLVAPGGDAAPLQGAK